MRIANAGIAAATTERRTGPRHGRRDDRDDTANRDERNDRFGGRATVHRPADRAGEAQHEDLLVTSRETVSAESEEWRQLLTHGRAAVRLSHRLFRHLPGDPRCKLCHNPFGGLAGRAFATIGCTPSVLNPNFCTRCVDKLPHGGAKVDVAVLFADIRGSTSLGETASPDDYADLLNRFYRTSTRVLVDHDAIIDKIVGDEVMALFVRGFAGPSYRRQAAEAGIDLVATLSREMDLPVGAAVNAGIAYVGSVGSDYVVDFTAVGDTVNTAARLQGHANSGELVLAEDVYHEVESAYPRALSRRLDIRGRAAPVDVRILAP